MGFRRVAGCKTRCLLSAICCLLSAVFALVMHCFNYIAFHTCLQPSPWCFGALVFWCLVLSVLHVHRTTLTLRQRLSSKHFGSGNDCDLAAVRAVGCQRQMHAPLRSAIFYSHCAVCTVHYPKRYLLEPRGGTRAAARAFIPKLAGYTAYTPSLAHKTAEGPNRMLLRR